jgi:hypothetical protein
MSAMRIGTLVSTFVLAGCNRSTALPPSGGVDLGVGDTTDLAVARDLAVRDLATRDLATRDLATRDLTTPDLTTRDLATRDLASTDLAFPPAPPFDGVCTPGAMGTSVYDPDCIYLFGTLQQGACFVDAFVYPPNPDDWVVGFGCYADQGLIRPDNGRFLYTEAIVATGGPLEFTVDDGPGFAQYPTMPQANDTDLQAGCPQGVWHIYAFRDGTPAWRCYNSPTVLHIGDAASTRTLTGNPIAFGAGRAVLVDEGSVLAIVDATSRTPVAGVPSSYSVVTARSTADGFRVVLEASDGTATLYKTDLTGAATSLGSYTRGTAFTSIRGCVLEPGGALQCFTQETPGLHDYITRFSISAAPVMLYDEALHTVKIHGSQLVTGP